jgi:enoyl-CoA hydratase/carnithine racemase
MANVNAVSFERVDKVAVLTMQLAPYNLLGVELAQGLRSNLKRAQEESCRAVVVRSALRHFSAGADLALFEEGGEMFPKLDPLGVLRAFEDLPLPIIASVHGVALGGGFELALACDYIVAAASAKFGLVEATLGLHPLMGGIQRVIDRTGAARGKEIAMLARRHDASTLERWNIINLVVPDANLQDVTMTIARELALGPTVAHACTKRLVNVHLREGLAASDEAMHEIEKPIWASKDLRTGLQSFTEKGPGHAIFEGR